MVLQTLFALSSLIPVVPGITPTTITVNGGRMFSAEVLVPKHVRTFDSKYPGAVVIATEDTRDRAYVVASRLSEIGVTVIMYTQEDFATYRLHLFDAKAAIDSLRRRLDVRSEEIGVVAFEEATSVVPDLARDSSLSFAIAASVGQSPQDLSAKYSSAHAATLLVQGVTAASADASAAQTTQTAGTKSDDGVPAPTPPPDDAQKMSPNVTLWPVSREQLETLGEAHSPLGARVVSWVKEQVHAIPTIQQLPTVSTH
jgi:hypothetical protein